MKFSEMGLSKPLLDSLTAMGFEIPTPIQEQAIPLLLQGKDIIGQAQTGTGKTAAFGLPILEAWVNSPHKKVDTHPGAAPHGAHARPAHGGYGHSGGSYGRTAASPSALILVPTRELAVQVTDSLIKMAKHTGARIIPIYGGVEMRKQHRMLQSQVDIVVGTPGRTLDHLRQRTLQLGAVRTVVLDEADHMLDMGFIRDVVRILEQTPTQRQTMLFSATMPREVVSIAQKYMKSPHTIKVSEDVLTVELTNQLYVKVNEANRFGMLLAAIRTLKPFLSVVFCRTKHGAMRLAKQLSAHGVPADAMHGNLRQNARERTMERFRAGKIDVLVATDLASRGIDVPGITHVFNFEMPVDSMTYVHRIGRTGRAGEKGTAVSFILGDTRRVVETIQHATGSPITELELVPETQAAPSLHGHEGHSSARDEDPSLLSSRGYSESGRTHGKFGGHSSSARASHPAHRAHSAPHAGHASAPAHSAPHAGHASAPAHMAGHSAPAAHAAPVRPADHPAASAHSVDPSDPPVSRSAPSQFGKEKPHLPTSRGYHNFGSRPSHGDDRPSHGADRPAHGGDRPSHGGSHSDGRPHGGSHSGFSHPPRRIHEGSAARKEGSHAGIPGARPRDNQDASRPGAQRPYGSSGGGWGGREGASNHSEGRRPYSEHSSERGGRNPRPGVHRPPKRGTHHTSHKRY